MAERFWLSQRLWVATFLHQGALRGPSHHRRCRRHLEGRFFLENSAQHRASLDEKKICMRRHTIFHSYCRYYYRMTTVVTTVVTIVATENSRPTHAIFILMYRCPMSGTNFF